MANKAAIDFGNSNTVIARWNDASQNPEILTVPEYAVPGTFLIPSKIAYEPDGRFFIGTQISKRSGPESREFRWMKRYINLRSPYSLRVGENRVDAGQAAEDFLRTLTAALFSASSDRPDELILSVPVESFEYYSEWLLKDISAFEGLPIRLIDEASAAAAGYGLRLQPGDSLLVVDFGGSTLQAVCVSVAEEAETQGRCCRVLGKAGCSLGGMTLDRWLFEDVLRRLKKNENDPLMHSLSAELLNCCENAKKQLSAAESVLFDFFPEDSFLLTREDLVGLFREHGLFETLDSLIEEALRTAEDHGLVREQLTAVLPVGGSCLIPALMDHLQSRFPAEIVIQGEPLGAVARGAAVIAGGMHIYDFIQHSYAIRYNDPVSGGYAFRTIIPKGTKYPSERVTNPIRLKASYDGQQRFGIAVYELRESNAAELSRNEIFFDDSGGVHVMRMTEAEIEAEQRFWLNERNPLFLSADVPAERGDRRPDPLRRRERDPGRGDGLRQPGGAAGGRRPDGRGRDPRGHRHQEQLQCGQHPHLRHGGGWRLPSHGGGLPGGYRHR